MTTRTGIDLHARGLIFGVLAVVFFLLAPDHGSARWTTRVVGGIVVALYGLLVWRQRDGKSVNVSTAFVVAPIIALVVVIVAMEAAASSRGVDYLIALGVPLTALGLALWAQHSRRRRLEN